MKTNDIYPYHWQYLRLFFALLVVLIGSSTASHGQGTNTVLVANFMNGNDAALNSRVYLWNPSASAGAVTVRVFTLPLRGGTAQELTTTPLDLGILGARSALNIKLAEDILDPLGRRPFTDEGGNLTLEFTIQATNVKGATQVFSSSLAFGTNPLQEIPSSSSGTPTVLVANFMNGNDAAFNSGIYLWNPSNSPGNVTARVFSLPLTSGEAQELTTTPLNLGNLEANSAMNIRLAEDILTPLGITLPYRTDGGNLTVELTIEAANVRGAAQVFSSSFAFGVYPLQVIPSTSGASPTVLVANFMNGNNDAFNSRIYLWNPSTSAGNVTVRVFTLPLGGGLAQELTDLPVSLGVLGAKSARNVKLAEDILIPLGISLPYTNDGGNLTLEFTIEAADVRGTAQVFSNGFAFGTYPLQEIPSTSTGSPTVLVANFMNGNNAALNSRVYLWNPWASAGAVTVRVFTLPLRGGTAQELTTTPLDLGILGARSALNIKLAEDILTPLGITTPYTTDGGNLTVEFMIQPPDVRGAAQVFSSDFAFGTYPLQVVPSAPPLVITSLSTTSAAPLQSLNITGSGFNSTADLSVRFSDDQEFTVDIPVVDVSATSVTVAVPPFVDVVTGEFASGTVNVQVVQSTGGVTVTSDPIRGFQIQDLPTSLAPAGTATLSFLIGAVDSARQLETDISGTALDTPELTAAIASQITDLETLIDEITAVWLDPSRTFTLGSIGGSPIIADASDLLAVDRLVIGILLAQGESGAVSSNMLALFAQQSSGLCAGSEARNLALTLEESIERNLLGIPPPSQSYWRALLKCVPEAAKTALKVVVASAGIAISGLRGLGASKGALALPRAALWSVKIQLWGWLIGVGTIQHNMGDPKGVETIKDGIKIIDETIGKPLKDIINPPDPLPEPVGLFKDLVSNALKIVSVTLTVNPTPPAGSLEVSPATGLSMMGNVGGPFTPPSQNYTLTNTGGTAISYNISKSQSWVSLSSTGGFLEPGLSTDVLVAINSNAVSLAAGTYSDTVTFTNTLNGNDNTSRSVELTVNAAGTLEVSPATGLSMTGDVGGPFTPPSQSYTLTNTGGTTITYTISKNANWVSLASTDGSLEPEASTSVLVAINSNAVSLAAGTYSDTVAFTNTTNGNGNTSRPVELTVNAVEPPPPPPDEVSITVETGICIVERFSWGDIISLTVETSGSVSGPVGTDFSAAGLSDLSCSSWSNCERTGAEPSTTGWTYSGYGIRGLNTMYYYASTESFSTTVTCPLN